jgi:hypothetical protein
MRVRGFSVLPVLCAQDELICAVVKCRGVLCAWLEQKERKFVEKLLPARAHNV